MSERCWCTRSALDDLLAEAQSWRLRETGGALLGWRDEQSAVIVKVLGPGPRAKHGFSSFEPDGDWQTTEGAAVYRASDRRIAYLGDWHSHPRGSSSPSRQDQTTARMISEDAGFRAPTALYAIASRRGTWRGPWALTIWEVRDGELEELELTVIDDQQVEAKLAASASG